MQNSTERSPLKTCMIFQISYSGFRRWNFSPPVVDCSTHNLIDYSTHKNCISTSNQPEGIICTSLSHATTIWSFDNQIISSSFLKIYPFLKSAWFTNRKDTGEGDICTEQPVILHGVIHRRSNQLTSIHKLWVLDIETIHCCNDTATYLTVVGWKNRLERNAWLLLGIHYILNIVFWGMIFEEWGERKLRSEEIDRCGFALTYRDRWNLEEIGNREKSQLVIELWCYFRAEIRHKTKKMRIR